MRKNLAVKAIALVLLASLTLTQPVSAAGLESAVDAPERTAPVMMVPQDEGVHTKYMEGTGNFDRFNPEKYVTRAELAQMLSRIAADEPEEQPAYTDVPQGAWYEAAVQKAAGLALMFGEDGLFRPGEPVTRAECAAALVNLIPYTATEQRTFPDVPLGYWAYSAITRTAAYGLFQGNDKGNFNPDNGLKRCEVVAVFNRLLGRVPDEQFIARSSPFVFFSDVPETHWAYHDIVEASISHNCAAGGGESWTWADIEKIEQPVLEDGPHRIDGRLYWVKNGEFVKNGTLYDMYFDAEGRYTTGNADLDAQLNAIVEAQTNDSMTLEQKLRALFDYVVKNYTYLARPMVAKGTANWEPEYAQFFLNNKKGNCFSFAAAYCLLSRELGCHTWTIVGASGKPTAPHSWVEIMIDGTVYMFDPELQWYYNNRTSRRYDLFMMRPAGIPAGVYQYFW